MCFSTPNARPGACAKCGGSGEYRSARIINGRTVTRTGACFACHGTGRQRRADIARNTAYNRYKLAELASAD
jgi:DnaJ-class molecular chaperone